METLTIDNTLVTPIPSWMLPADLHDLAAKWEDLNDKAERAESAVYAAQGNLEDARGIDGLALKNAIIEGASDPGTPNIDKAEADLANAVRIFHATNTALSETA